jgi:aldehyde dehydrogenase (NAD+)
MEKIFNKALELDLGCSEFTSFLTSYKITITEVEDSIANMNSWAKTRSLDTTMMAGPAFSYIKPEPYGVVLVMSAWNYPLYTAIPPLA